MIESEDFPRLTPANHRITSPESPEYNCIAWCAGDTQHWWQPGMYWPTREDDCGIPAVATAFASLGFSECEDDQLEPTFEKVAIYGSSLFYTHAARQLATGRWTSKLGRAQDIEHNSPDDIAGGLYGEVVLFMRRPAAQTISTRPTP